MTDDEQADAATITKALRMGTTAHTLSILQWSTGPYWPQKMRLTADWMAAAIPALRRMADWLDARQPEEQPPKRDELGRCPCCRMYRRHASGCPSIHNHEEGKQ